MQVPIESLLADVDLTRQVANSALNEESRSDLGQYMTPGVVAEFMASMFERLGPEIRVLDAGAGVGSLSAALIREAISRDLKPSSIDVTAYELDSVMLTGLREVLESCEAVARQAQVDFSSRIVDRDFIAEGTSILKAGLYADAGTSRFNAAILNPPYRKLASQSTERSQLRAAGIEAGNLYSAFVSLAIKLLQPGGELVAITPRSFCNGPYFRAFRKLLLDETVLLRVHVFDSRRRAFRDDAVLQENIIFHARKGGGQGTIMVSTSSAPGEVVHERNVPLEAVVNPKDVNSFIHLPTNDEDEEVARRMAKLPCDLTELGLSVSTGRVVDFRVRDNLRPSPGSNTAPMVYPCHFDAGAVSWPKPNSRKPNAIRICEETRSLFVPNATYVLTKRFTSKEERRRVVATICDPGSFPDGVEEIGVENHVNYFHTQGKGIPVDLARGLSVYLNSTFVDRYFRQFNGHTQVNATDLRSIRYPDSRTLKALGMRIGTSLPPQEDIDQALSDSLS